MEMTQKEAQKFMDEVEALAEQMTEGATARTLKMTPAKLNRKMLEACRMLKKFPPTFSSKRKPRVSKRGHYDQIRTSGRGGASKRVPIPSYVFDSLGWDAGDRVKIYKSGKSKIVIEKL